MIVHARRGLDAKPVHVMIAPTRQDAQRNSQLEGGLDRRRSLVLLCPTGTTGRRLELWTNDAQQPVEALARKAELLAELLLRIVAGRLLELQ